MRESLFLLMENQVQIKVIDQKGWLILVYPPKICRGGKLLLTFFQKIEYPYIKIKWERSQREAIWGPPSLT